MGEVAFSTRSGDLRVRSEPDGTISMQVLTMSLSHDPDHDFPLLTRLIQSKTLSLSFKPSTWSRPLVTSSLYWFFFFWTDS